MFFYFFDTSALVKRYHLERGSDRINTIFDEPDSTLIISELAIVELASALQRKRNRGEISVEAMNDALARFATDALRDLVVAGFRSGHIQRARDLVLQLGLRTLDALHLASASECVRLCRCPTAAGRLKPGPGCFGSRGSCVEPRNSGQNEPGGVAPPGFSHRTTSHAPA